MVTWDIIKKYIGGKMKKIFYVLCMLLVVLVGCGKSEEKDGTMTLKVSTLSGPGDAHTEALEIFKTKLEEYSNQTIKVEVYPSGSLFSAEQDFPALLQGDVDMVYVAPTFFATYLPEFSMFASAYLFRDYDHMRAVLGGEIGQELFKSVTDEFGIVPLDVFYLGARQLNTRKEIKSLKHRTDLNGLKLRMPNTPTWLEVGRALGANPSPLSFSEVYLALKTGTIDGQDNPLGTVENAKFYEVAPNIILTNHMIDTVWPTMAEKTWKKLSEEQKGYVMKAIKDARKYVDETNLERDKDLVEKFKKLDVNVKELDATSLDIYRKEVQEYYLNNKELSKDWNLELYEKIQKL